MVVEIKTSLIIKYLLPVKTSKEPLNVDYYVHGGNVKSMKSYNFRYPRIYSTARCPISQFNLACMKVNLSKLY